MQKQEAGAMFSQDLIGIMQAEREREIEADLRVRRLLGRRRPFIRWQAFRRPSDGGNGRRGR